MYYFCASELLLKRLIVQGKNGYIKRGSFTTEIIIKKQTHLFSSKTETKPENFAGLFLFSTVRKEAKEFCKKRFKLPPKYDALVYAKKPPSGTITGTDLNHAYWRIAYNLGIISEKTYLKGLEKAFKTTRLAALSTLGKGKKYNVIADGKITSETVIIGEDKKLQNVYLLIRYHCYLIMNQLKTMLGKDFVAYKTDCIYYIKTKENIKMVQSFLDDNELLYKQVFKN